MAAIYLLVVWAITSMAGTSPVFFCSLFILSFTSFISCGQQNPYLTLYMEMEIYTYNVLMRTCSAIKYPTLFIMMIWYTQQVQPFYSHTNSNFCIKICQSTLRDTCVARSSSIVEPYLSIQIKYSCCEVVSSQINYTPWHHFNWERKSIPVLNAVISICSGTACCRI